MSRVRRANTQMEMALRSALHQSGYRFRVDFAGVFGRPDIAFTRDKVAVFVDGDFWHGRVLQEQGIAALRTSLKTERRQFWVRKICRNVERDRDVNQELRQSGWVVIRLWETDLKKDLTAGIETVVEAIQASRRRRNG